MTDQGVDRSSEWETGAIHNMGGRELVGDLLIPPHGNESIDEWTNAATGRVVWSDGVRRSVRDDRTVDTSATRAVGPTGATIPDRRSLIGPEELALESVQWS